MALTEIRAVQGVRHYEKAVMTSSRQVACVFNTCHENITDIIDTLFDKTKHELTIYSKVISFFDFVKTTDSDGKVKTDYYMNKDGFLLVVARLTGNGILESTNLPMLLEYIAAFNTLQNRLILERYQNDYYENAPDRSMLIMDLLSNASQQSPKKLEAALAYYADYIPGRLKEIYEPYKETKRRRY